MRYDLAPGPYRVDHSAPPGGPERSTERAATAGRRRAPPITDALNLAAVGVKTGNRGEVIVDAELCTHNPRSGCRQRHWPVAVRVRGWRARRADRRQCGHASRALDHRHLPRVAFTDPQLGTLGRAFHTCRRARIPKPACGASGLGSRGYFNNVSAAADCQRWGRRGGPPCC